MKVTYEFDVDSEDERAWWPVKGSDGLLWALPKPSAFNSGVKVTVERNLCPGCGVGEPIVTGYDGVNNAWDAHCSNHCGWTS